jgi:hypothetical protein
LACFPGCNGGWRMTGVLPLEAGMLDAAAAAARRFDEYV